MKNRLILVLLLLTIAFRYTPLHAQLSSEFVTNSVMKITVSYDDGKEYATGFLWKDKKTLVTSYHVVKSGYKSITVQDIQGWKASAKISKVYKPADLMLLEITSEPGESWTPFNVTSPKVDIGEKTKAYGYNGTASGIVPISLEKAEVFPSSTLRYAIPVHDRDALEELGFPSLKLPIMYLLGSLLPGYSGSPIVNQRGQLVAIGDGGLNKGTTSSSWGIPVENLNKLVSSDVRPASSGSSRLFSAGTVSTLNRKNADEYKLNNSYDFFFTKRVKLKDIIEHSDNPSMIQGILDLYKDFNFDLENLEFDIYQEVTSNYVFVTPKDAEVTNMGNYLRLFAYENNLYATLTPNGVVKGSLQEFTDWTMRHSDDSVGYNLVFNEEAFTSPKGVMRTVDLMKYDKINQQTTSYLIKKGLSVNDLSAFIQARIWLKDLNTNDFIDCYTADNDSGCSAKVKERVRIMIIGKIMMNLMTIANTKVLDVSPLKDLTWTQQGLAFSCPETLTFETVNNTEIESNYDGDGISLSISAEKTNTLNDYSSLINFMEGWASRLPTWEIFENSVPDKVQDINGLKAVYGFFNTGNGSHNALLFAAYKPENPNIRYSWIVIFDEEKIDTVEEMIHRFGKN